jgi:hypothetical protein
VNSLPRRPKGRKASAGVSALPRKILGSELERMSGLDPGFDLQVLAAESGYSRSRFLRTFSGRNGKYAAPIFAAPEDWSERKS